jgi:hypothetical protein
MSYIIRMLKSMHRSTIDTMDLHIYNKWNIAYIISTNKLKQESKYAFMCYNNV